MRIIKKKNFSIIGCHYKDDKIFMPAGFFDSKNTGDLLQRMDDHKRIESFLTNSSLPLVSLIFFIAL